MDKEEERDPYTAGLSTPRVGDDPVAERPAPELHRSAPNPKTGIGDGGQQAAPAGHAADRPRSGRRGPRARESVDKEEEREGQISLH